MTVEYFKGTDSLNNAISVQYVYHDVGDYRGSVSSYSNESLMGGTANDMYCFSLFNPERLTCRGTATLSNGIVLDFGSASTGNNILINFTEQNDGTDDMIALRPVLQDGEGAFTTNVGYTGAVTYNADGSSSGTLVNAAGATVATFSCDTGGMCSVDYTDTSLADEQYYATNILDTLK
jgi:hypothetical protein